MAEEGRRARAGISGNKHLYSDMRSDVTESTKLLAFFTNSSMQLDKLTMKVRGLSGGVPEVQVEVVSESHTKSFLYVIREGLNHFDIFFTVEPFVSVSVILHLEEGVVIEELNTALLTRI